MINENNIVQYVLEEYPNTQAIYLFGSIAAKEYTKNSDIDIALLLPVNDAKLEYENLFYSELHNKLAKHFNCAIDLINLRKTSTVFQKEVIAKGKRISCNDRYTSDEFEMITLSKYQKLNEERKDLLKEFWESGRAYKI